MNDQAKLIISIAYDASDFFVGRIPIFGTLYDLLGTMLGFWLWGTWGLTQGLEVLDFTDQIDGFIPTLTIIGLLKMNKVI